jgi:hypothetical protein
MLNYSETTNVRPLVPHMPILGKQADKYTGASLPACSSYAIGPLDAAHLITTRLHLSSGEQCSLLVPRNLPQWILSDSAFQKGYERNYTLGEEPEEEWTVTRLVNSISLTLLELDEPQPTLSQYELGRCPWLVGWLLCDLTRLAETDRTLALVGLAHLGFLLSFFPQDPSSSCRPPTGSYQADVPCGPYGPLIQARGSHSEALRAYRARVRVSRGQGKSFAEAQRLAWSAQDIENGEEETDGQAHS